MPKGWYSLVQNKAESAYEAELTVYDEIGGWGVTASQLIGQLKGIKGRILLRLNTPGGSVFDAVAIYNFLRQHKGGCDTVVDGWALSGGSILMLAGEKRTMGSAAMIMVHSAWSMGMGNGDDLRKQADLLDKINVQLATIYTERTGQGDEVVAEWLKDTDGHWFGADEAVALGFANVTVASQKMAAKFDPAAFAARYNAPSAALECFEPTKEELMKIEELQAALHAANVIVASKDIEIAGLNAKLLEASQANDNAAAELQAAQASLAAEKEAHSALQAKCRTDREARITASVDALVASGRVKKDGRDALVAACLGAQDDGAAILASIAPASVIIRQTSAGDSKTKTRAEFESLSHADRAAFFRSGGKLTE